MMLTEVAPTRTGTVVRLTYGRTVETAKVSGTVTTAALRTYARSKGAHSVSTLNTFTFELGTAVYA